MLELPDLICLSDFNGDYSTYIDAVYSIFRNDFVRSRPTFRGVRLGLKARPITHNREYTFYHLTHSGEIEDERLPDLERCERIAWIRPMIENPDCENLLVWRKPNGNRSHRILIYCPEERYLVVLEDRGDYILPWTAYIVQYENRHRKLLNEHSKYSI